MVIPCVQLPQAVLDATVQVGTVMTTPVFRSFPAEFTHAAVQAAAGHVPT